MKAGIVRWSKGVVFVLRQGRRHQVHLALVWGREVLDILHVPDGLLERLAKHFPAHHDLLVHHLVYSLEGNGEVARPLDIHEDHWKVAKKNLAHGPERIGPVEKKHRIADFDER